jgi:hypothetical protein
MRARQREHHFLLQEWADNKPFWIGDWGADEGDIDPFIAQIVDKLHRSTFFQCERDQRERFTVTANDARYEGMKGSRAGEPHSNATLLTACGALGRRNRLIDVGQNGTRFGEQRRSSVGQFHAAWPTPK